MQDLLTSRLAKFANPHHLCSLDVNQRNPNRNHFGKTVMIGWKINAGENI
jgi:hypothetical protein